MHIYESNWMTQSPHMSVAANVRSLKCAVYLQVNKTGESVMIQPATGSAANLVEADVPVCKATMDVIDTLLFASVSSLPPSAAAQLAAMTAGR